MWDTEGSKQLLLIKLGEAGDRIIRVCNLLLMFARNMCLAELACYVKFFAARSLSFACYKLIITFILRNFPKFNDI